MNVENATAPYMLIVRTSEYTGNFERELCAYATGGLGDCAVGDEAAEVYAKEAPPEFTDLADVLSHQADDHGNRRPVSIWDCDDAYQSLAIFLEDLPTDAELKYIASRIRAFPAYSELQQFGQRNLQILGIELIERSITIVDTKLAEL